MGELGGAPTGGHIPDKLPADTAKPVGIPKPASAEAPNRPADAALERHLAAKRTDFEKSTRNLGNFISSTVSAYGSVARDAAERVTDNEGYARLKGHMVDMLRADRARRMEEIERRIKEREKILKESCKAQTALCKSIDLPGTQKDLTALSASAEVYKTAAELARMQNNPYSEKPEEEVLETKELVRLRSSYACLERLNTEEWVDTMVEDAEFTDMLQEAQKNALIDLGDQELEHLMNFILGRPEPEHDAEQRLGLKEKSGDRQQFEVFLWVEIVKRLDFRQKIDLVETFLEQEGADAAKKFIAQAIVAGAMNRLEVTEMLKDDKRGADIAAKFGQNFQDFDDYLKGAAIAKGDVADAADNYAKRIERPQIQNAAAYFFTFDKMIGETVGRLGALTAVLGGLTDVLTAVRDKKPNDSWGATITKGFKDALTDPYVIGGAATAYIGSNIVWPYGKEMINKPGGAEKELLEKHGEEKYLTDIAKNRHEVMDALVPRYDDFLAIAKKNLDDGKTGPDGKKRYSSDIWPDDIRLTDEEAGKMGCRNTNEAKVLLIRLFGACSKVLRLKGDEKIDSAQKLKAYLSEHDPSHKHT